MPEPVEERSLTVVSPSTWEPLSTDDAKTNLREDGSAQDGRIDELIQTAREVVEEATGRALTRKRYRLTLDAFPPESEIPLPRPPLVADSTATPITVQYVKQDGTTATFASSRYFVDTDAEPGRIVLEHSENWPAEVLRPAAAVQVTYSAGYEDESSVPERAKQYMHLLVGHWYENREAVAVGTVTKEIELAVKSLRAALLVPEVP
ncbi:MAG: head-tail connector protein [Gemmatimonadota bacterium]